MALARTRGRLVVCALALCVAGMCSHDAVRADGTRRERAARAPHVYAQALPVEAQGATYYPIAFDGHVHTHHSPDAVIEPHAVLAIAQRVGLDAVMFTDHGSTQAASEVAGNSVKSAPGQEIGGMFGHAVMWNTPARDLGGNRVSLAQRAAFAHDSGGLIVLAHPGWWINGNKRDPAHFIEPDALRAGGVSADIDAVEIWNGVYSAPTRKLIDAWTRLLDLGIYVPVVGGSDFHNPRIHRLGHPRNVALCRTPELESVFEAVKHGRVYITAGPTLVLTANGALPGDVVSATPDSAVHVSIEALAPYGGTLIAFVGRTEWQRIELAPNERTSKTLELPMPAEDSYLRVEIEQPGRRGMTLGLLSNPILLDPGPARTSWR